MMSFNFETTLIFDAEQCWGHAREPVLRRMPDDSLFCLHYSGGPREPDDCNVVLATRSEDDGKTWSEAEVLFQHPARGVWGTEIFVEEGQPRIFVHTLEAANHYIDLRVYQSLSEDSGRSWSMPTSVPGGVNGGSIRQGVVLADGTWLFPFYWQEVIGGDGWLWERRDGRFGGGSPHYRFFSGVLRSTDQGKSYSLHGNLRAKCSLWEPNAVEVAPGHLVMYLRAHRVLYRADSHDGGLTWNTPMPSEIPNPGTKFTLLNLDGTILLVNNAHHQERVSLSIWRSTDACQTWEKAVDVCSPETRMFYPHAFADRQRDMLYLASEDGCRHYLSKIPLEKLL